jgi:hypothetical protein
MLVVHWIAVALAAAALALIAWWFHFGAERGR